MRILYSKLGEPATSVWEIRADRVSLGRGAANDLVLDSPYIAERAALLCKTEGGWELAAAGENEVSVGSRAIHPGERALIDGRDLIEIYPYSIRLDLPSAGADTDGGVRERLDAELSELILQLHRELLQRMDLPGAGKAEGEPDRSGSESYLYALESDIDELARLAGFGREGGGGLVEHGAALTIQAELLASVLDSAGHENELLEGRGGWSRLFTAVPEFERDLSRLLGRCRTTLGIDAAGTLSDRINAVETRFWSTWQQVAPGTHDDLRRYLALRHVKKQIKDIVFGYGPLEDLLRMPTISEIMVVDRHRIYVEKNGVLEQSGRRFVSDDVTVAIIERVVSRVGRRIDKSQPLVDARLADGSRVNAVIPPLAISGPCLTIRKFPSRRLRIENLVDTGSLTPAAAEFLRAAVAARKNVLVSGGTGTGKTTLLNCLSNFIPDKERIVTIEDTAELQLDKQHVVRMETKSANVEGSGEYAIRDLVRNSLRMRPDRIVVGECRGPEALDMLQAMNTGHDGSMTTIHANSAADVALRLEVLVQMASDLPVESIHRQVASAIDLVVQLSRERDGRRVISQITEVVDYDPVEKRIRLKDLFVRDSQSGHQLAPTGSIPTFMAELLESRIISLDALYV